MFFQARNNKNALKGKMAYEKNYRDISFCHFLIFTMTSISFFAEGAGPEIDGNAYVMINSETNQVLCGNEVEREVDPSSLTSLAIAYLYITRTSDLEKEITVNFNASDADVPGSISDMLGLRRNNTVTASDLLAAVFANAYPDAVRALADRFNISGKLRGIYGRGD